jgi:hypothetical protein
MEMGSELVEKWKQTMPERFQALRAVGHLTYFGLRLGNPWITRIPKALGIAFPITGESLLRSSSGRILNMPGARGNFVYRNLANAMSVLGVLPLVVLFLDDRLSVRGPIVPLQQFHGRL